jgi:hypothetical protein
MVLLLLVAWHMKPLVNLGSLFPLLLPFPSYLHEYYHLIIHSATKRNIGVTPDLVEHTTVLILARRRILSVRGDPCRHP